MDVSCGYLGREGAAVRKIASQRAWPKSELQETFIGVE
jgi:hypothetical protein